MYEVEKWYSETWNCTRFFLRWETFRFLQKYQFINEEGLQSRYLFIYLSFVIVFLYRFGINYFLDDATLFFFKFLFKFDGNFFMVGSIHIVIIWIFTTTKTHNMANRFFLIWFSTNQMAVLKFDQCIISLPILMLLFVFIKLSNHTLFYIVIIFQ